MIYVMKFMFYVLIGISVTILAGLYVAWSMDGKKVSLMDYCKTF